MKHFLLIFSVVLLFSCTKYVYVPVETVRIVERISHDTIIWTKLVPTRDSVSIRDTFSLLSNKYSYSVAEWHSGLLNHSLVVKDVAIPVKIQYINTTIHDTTSRTIVQPLSKVDANKLKTYDAIKEKASKRLGTVWKLIGLLSLSVLFILRKPIFAIISKLIKPI